MIPNKPNQNLVARKSIKLLLKSLLATEDDLPLKVEALVAEAIILLQQLGKLLYTFRCKAFLLPIATMINHRTLVFNAVFL